MASRRIAVFRALYLGDLLVAVPALRALRRRFPRAEVTLISLPWAEQLAERYPHYLDRFLPFPGFPGITEVPYEEERTVLWLEAQRDYGYDLAIQMHGSGATSNAFVLALGAGRTAGYYPSMPPPGLAPAAPYPDGPEVWRNLDLMRLLGARRLDPRLEFPLTAADHAAADALLLPLVPDQRPVAVGAGYRLGVVRPPRAFDTESTARPSGGRTQVAPTRTPVGRPLLVIHPGAKSPERRWPPSRFATVADVLARDHGAAVVLTGSTAEAPLTAAVAAAMRTPALDLAGRTTLGSLGALIARADLFMGNDTGPAHLADALDIPSIAVTGAAEGDRWLSLDQARHPAVRPAVPCRDHDCPGGRCVLAIEPEDVLAVAERLLARGVAA